MNNIKTIINTFPVCNDGKRSITQLVQFLRPDLDIEVPMLGDVWLTDSERIVLIGDDRWVQIDELFPFANSDTNGRGDAYVGYVNDGYLDNIYHSYWVKRLSKSISNYFANRDKILTDLRAQFPLTK